MTIGAIRPRLLLIAGLVPFTVGCGITVDRDDHDRNANVNITTPVGNLSVQANSDTAPDTGLPVHAGARAVHDREHDNANVNIEGGFFGVKVAVAKFEDDATPQAIADYYQKELAKFGAVTECRGNLDFKHGSAPPRCKERSRDEMQLGAGSEQDNHTVAIKPRGNGSEFTLVHVRTRD